MTYKDSHAFPFTKPEKSYDSCNKYTKYCHKYAIFVAENTQKRLQEYILHFISAMEH